MTDSAVAREATVDSTGMAYLSTLPRRAVTVYLPLVLPPVVTGYVLLLWFGRQGPIGRWLDEHLGIVFAFRWTIRPAFPIQWSSP